MPDALRPGAAIHELLAEHLTAEYYVATEAKPPGAW